MKIKYIQNLGNREYGTTSVIWFPYRKISSTAFGYNEYYSKDIIHVNGVSIYIYTKSQIEQDLEEIALISVW